ncbi:hypothetical protein BGX38DRAFT_1146692 [Terfezia claveryi]|nr:hypothetical protein BGX38DRAFT_1146692 [Terfezia claveryi]
MFGAQRPPGHTDGHFLGWWKSSAANGIGNEEETQWKDADEGSEFWCRENKNSDFGVKENEIDSEENESDGEEKESDGGKNERNGRKNEILHVHEGNEISNTVDEGNEILNADNEGNESMDVDDCNGAAGSSFSSRTLPSLCRTFPTLSRTLLSPC